MFNLKQKPTPPTETEQEDRPLSFHVDDVFMRFGERPEDVLTWRDVTQGTVIFGAAGSGKSRVGIQSYFKRAIRPVSKGGAEAGALVAITRPNEGDMYEAWAKEEGRADDVIRLQPNGEWAFAILRKETEHLPPLMKPMAARLIAKQVGELLNMNKGKGGDAFFDASSEDAVSHAATILNAAGRPITLTAIDDIIASAPLEDEEMDSDSFYEGLCGIVLSEALDRKDAGELSKEELNDFQRSQRYFTHDFPQMADRTRSSILATYATISNPLLSGMIRKLFFSDTPTLDIDQIIDEGKILILDLPVRLYGEAAQLIQMLCIWHYGRALERRKIAPDDVSTRLSLVLLDEFQLYIVPSWFESFLSTVRGSRGMVVCASQSISALYERLDPQRAHHSANAILGNLQTKLILSTSDHATADWLAKAIGMVHKTKANASTGHSYGATGGGNFNSGMSTQQQLEYAVLPVEFSLLRKADASGTAGALVWHTGKLWEASREHYLFTELSLKDLHTRY